MSQKVTVTFGPHLWTQNKHPRRLFRVRADLSYRWL